MTSELVLCKLIDVPKAGPDDRKLRTFSKDFAANLAESIRIEGLLQPVVLRPHPERPGRYLLVAGRHRLHAVASVLKHEAIEAKVIADMDDTEARMAAITENLWFKPLTRTQHLLALKKWHDYYVVKYPDRVGKRAGGLGRGAQQREAKARRDADPADGAQAAAQRAASPNSGLAAPEPDPKPTPRAFGDLVADATGQTRSGAYASVKLAKTFTSDQIEIFDAMGVRQYMMEKIAAVQDEAKRNEIVNLIAGGMEPDDAIQRAQAAGGAPDPAAASGPAPRPDADLSDEQWAEKWCPNLWAKLHHKGRFLADVKLYRGAAPSIGQMKAKLGRLLKSVKGPRGALVRMLQRLTNLSHPSRWLLCGMCRGTGAGDRGQICEACYGDGYKTTSWV